MKYLVNQFSVGFKSSLMHSKIKSNIQKNSILIAQFTERVFLFFIENKMNVVLVPHLIYCTLKVQLYC